MLQFNAAMANTAAKEAFNAPLSDKTKSYLKSKGFSEEFIEWLPLGYYISRTAKIYNAKNIVLQLLIMFNCTYNQAHDSICTNSSNTGEFFFGKDVEGNPAAYEVSVGHLVEIIDDKDLNQAWSWYLGQFWLKPAKFKDFVNLGMTVGTPAKVPAKFIQEFGRFNLTVDDAKDILYKTRGEIWSDDDLGEGEDDSRSIDAIKRREFFDSLTEDEEILWKISRKYEKMLLNTNYVTEFRNLYSPEAIYSIDDIHKGCISLNNITYTKEGTEKKLGAFSRIWYFWEFYKNNQIDKEVLGYLAGVNSWVLDRFFEQNAQ